MMNPAKIYHVKNPTFDETLHNWPEDYELVAEVLTESLCKAFGLTNHVDHPWWDNPEVMAHSQTRSTSVGDIVEINGKYHLCSYAGWLEVQEQAYWK
jgi:hypothetical protein